MKVPSHVVRVSAVLNSLYKSLIPVVMSGIIAVYGLVVSVLITGSSQSLICFNRCVIVDVCYLLLEHSQTSRIFTILRVRALGRWVGLWIHWHGRWLRYWNRWGFCAFHLLLVHFRVSLLHFPAVCTSLCAGAEDLRLNGVDHDLCRGVGTVRVRFAFFLSRCRVKCNITIGSSLHSSWTREPRE